MDIDDLPSKIKPQIIEPVELSQFVGLHTLSGVDDQSKITGLGLSPYDEARELFFIMDGNRIHIPMCELATNDGLFQQDYEDWFSPLFNKKKDADGKPFSDLTLDFAIIHFTKFRY